LFDRDDVDIIVALGPTSSDLLAHRRPLSKPVIAALVVDAQLQGLPVKEGTSGVKNLSYINVAYSAFRTMQLFHQLVPFQKLAVLMQPGPLEQITSLRPWAKSVAESLGVSIAFVPVTTSAAAALASLPAEADAVYLGPLEQLGEASLDSLIQGLN